MRIITENTNWWKVKIFFFLTFHFLLFAGLGISTELLAPEKNPKSETELLLAEADKTYAERATEGACKKALELFKKGLSLDGKNYEALWKIARCYKWLGDHAPQKERLMLFTECKTYVEKAVALYPDKWEGHYWLGVALGRYGEEKGVFKSLALVQPIRNEMETVIKINPSHALAYHVLGVLYRKAPGWPLSIGDKKKALEYARKANSLNPASTLTKLGLAEAYYALGMKKEAKEELQKLLDMPGEPDRKTEAEEDKKQARLLLKKLE